MPTTFQNELEKVFNALLQREPEWGACMAQVKDRIAHGFYPSWFVDACFQNWRDMPPTLPETYCFSQLYSHYRMGHIGVCHIDVGAEPSGDKMIEANQRALDNGLYLEMFEAKYLPGTGRSAWDDGWIKWKAPLDVTRISDGGTELWECSPRQLPLEVGTTHVTKTFEHVVGEAFGVARWPYRYKEIIVLAAHPSLRASLKRDTSAL